MLFPASLEFAKIVILRMPYEVAFMVHEAVTFWSLFTVPNERVAPSDVHPAGRVIVALTLLAWVPAGPLTVIVAFTVKLR
ncbi:Uncharacterised protein [uncultured archaeon]|nr:Uncharacterised protein [uncultured archaeon]